MRHKGGLHLKTRDVLASAPQVILLTVNKIEIPVGIELSDIPGMEPKIAHDPQGFLGPMPIAVEHDRRLQGPNDDLARDTGCNLAVVVVHDSDIEVFVASPRRV